MLQKNNFNWIKRKKTELINEFNDLSEEEKKVINKLLAKLSHISTHNAEERKGTTIEEIESYENAKDVERLIKSKKQFLKVLFKNYNDTFLFLTAQFKKTTKWLTIDVIKTAYKICKFNVDPGARVFRTEPASAPYAKTKLMKAAFIESHMHNFTSWFNNPYKDKELSLLDNSFLLHHYFEIVHPFSDGNGRLGRILLIFFWIINDLWPEKIHPLYNYVVKLKRNYYLDILENFPKTDIQKEKFNTLTKKEGCGLNYLSFLKKEKISYDSYLKEMLSLYKLSIFETNEFIKQYKKEKNIFINKLKNLVKSSKFKIFKSKKISLEKLTQLCFFNHLNPYQDIATKMNIDVRTLTKIIKETNLFIDVNLTNPKIVGGKIKNFANKKISNYFQKAEK